MIEDKLITMAEKALASKPRRMVTLPDLLAVCWQESKTKPIWENKKPKSLYSANVASACTFYLTKTNPITKQKYKAGPYQTGFSREDIKRMITIPAEFNGYKVDSALVGQEAKFRFEAHHWVKQKWAHLKPEDRFWFVSSWGVVQFMGWNVSKTDVNAIKRFAYDVPLQLLYAAGMLDDLMVRAKGSLFGAYKGYNSGDVNSTQKAVIDRANEVLEHRRKIVEFLKRRTNGIT